MTGSASQRRRVLALVPHSKGLGYAVFEGVRTPVDWGLKRVRGDKNAATLAKASLLIGIYSPDTIVMEDVKESRRSERIKTLIATIAEYASDLGIAVTFYGKQAVFLHFAYCGASTKHAIAKEIARRIPALRARLPEPRKPWQSEDYRLSIFLASALCWLELAATPGAETRDR